MATLTFLQMVLFNVQLEGQSVTIEFDAYISLLNICLSVIPNEDLCGHMSKFHHWPCVGKLCRYFTIHSLD